MSDVIKVVESILSENGFTSDDYTISLQGPTLIPTESGNAKLNNDLDLKITLISIIKFL
jgi:hypothetical protein